MLFILLRCGFRLICSVLGWVFCYLFGLGCLGLVKIVVLLRGCCWWLSLYVVLTAGFLRFRWFGGYCGLYLVITLLASAGLRCCSWFTVYGVGIVCVCLYINCGCLVPGDECDVAALGCGGLLVWGGWVLWGVNSVVVIVSFALCWVVLLCSGLFGCGWLFVLGFSLFCCSPRVGVVGALVVWLGFGAMVCFKVVGTDLVGAGYAFVWFVYGFWLGCGLLRLRLFACWVVCVG